MIEQVSQPNLGLCHIVRETSKLFAADFIHVVHLIHNLLGVFRHGDGAACNDLECLADSLIHLVMLAGQCTQQLAFVSECALNKSLLERAEVDLDHVEHSGLFDVAKLLGKVLECLNALCEGRSKQMNQNKT